MAFCARSFAAILMTENNIFNGKDDIKAIKCKVMFTKTYIFTFAPDSITADPKKYHLQLFFC